MDWKATMKEWVLENSLGKRLTPKEVGLYLGLEVSLVRKSCAILGKYSIGRIILSSEKEIADAIKRNRDLK